MNRILVLLLSPYLFITRMELIFITGIGTDIGKTIAASIVTEALAADYWKPIQAGLEDGTDASNISSLVSNPSTIIHPDTYRLHTPASPHIAARIDDIKINLETIVQQIPISQNKYLVIEGAGGLMVPLNEDEFVIDLIQKLKTRVILVSKNYLGSINHSLMTAAICKQRNIPVIGWIFNQQYLNYEEEIVNWSGYPKLHSIPFALKLDKEFILQQASLFRNNHSNGL